MPSFGRSVVHFESSRQVDTDDTCARKNAFNSLFFVFDSMF